ncbi:MAG: hypothetical protein JGK24_18860 [Microcoleus sp. PH2017_29_MFU_D_A]|nr:MULTISPECIES: hypothetical protein [unclassified Microcoleus]MCC3467101.1 hypothetical protein [Microcoleus sp. PH2017_06_SFM_O_A]MCC3412218.1 hypothetical protein [Microcoleus sp. PH2017_02_FOX_O_A]MCC3437194.1 hypothetical protein [Microcoleus sp. PH2017_05_CCC_O_A]MCC3448232.1 hypothetical protein [Microcoleus sp. PH2017_09_SFU_O_A]MCC3457234.1 hypothetical protein [Microcoleus sp. PH2017_08_TRC_O_A]
MSAIDLLGDLPDRSDVTLNFYLVCTSIKSIALARKLSYGRSPKIKP